MKQISAILLLSIFSLPAFGHYVKSPNQSLDFGLSTNGNQYTVALGWNHLHGLGKKKNFRIGYGIRYSQNWGKNATFTTAPAELTSGQTGLGVIFSPYVDENLDTLVFNQYSTGSLNLSLHLNYRFHPKWEVEFNIDALGLSFGKEQNASYTTSKSGPYAKTQLAKPTSPNVLLTSDNDIGSLNSELMLRFWIKDTWALRAGATFIFSEYTTKNKLYLDNDRFRNKALMGLVGISFNPFRKKS